MNPLRNFSPELMLSRGLLDTMIRVGVIGFLAVQCYRVLEPFLSLLLWSLILAVTLYPLQRRLVALMGGREGRAATVLTVLTLLLIMGPVFTVAGSVAESAGDLVKRVTSHELQLPKPADAVASWPLVGPKLFDLWNLAATDLPALLKQFKPQLENAAKFALAAAAGIGGATLSFAASIVVAGIIMAFGESGSRAAEAIFSRLAGTDIGPKLASLSTSTIRAVAQGVIGIAFLQAILVGAGLVLAGVPAAGLLALAVLLLGIAQVPGALVIFPTIGYIWTQHDPAHAIGFTIMLLLAGSIDNVLKPLVLGRGVDAPMPVILLGALGGAIAGGMIGMFVGAVMLALGYQILMVWVYMELPEGDGAQATSEQGG